MTTTTYPNSPYYDDFDETKKFYRILFKPGRAVQARELTQLQTSLHNQISSFANHVFKEGSVVSGGEHSLDDSVFYIKCKTQYSGTDVDFSSIEGKYIVEDVTNRIGYVKKFTAATDTDEPTLHVTVVEGAQQPFADDTVFSVTDTKGSTTVTNTFESIASSASGEALLFHVNEGIFYGKETFLFNTSQTIVLGKYSKTVSAIVGLDITESIVTSDDDSDLLDPAVGSSNYFAPGADRYKIDLTLAAMKVQVKAILFN